MAEKTHVTVVDDLDGAEGAATVTFGVDGHAYEIDLTSAHKEELYAALEPFMQAGRKTREGNARKPRGGRQKARADKEQLQAIRAWARSQGHEVSDRGRVPAQVVAAFEEAHRAQ